MSSRPPSPAALGLALAALGLLATPAAAQGESLVADLSSHLINITSSYTGAELVLFGSSTGEGEIAVVVRGPPQPQVVRRKTRFLGIWINSAAVTFTNAPGFYAVAATRPLADFAPPALLAHYGIGAENLRLETATPFSAEKLRVYREALVRNRRRAQLFSGTLGKVEILGDRLFRTNIEIPANAPVGTYAADFYLIRGEQVIAQQSRPMTITKVGLERAVFDFANQRPAAYGVVAVLLAILGGWLAAVSFRRT